MRRVVTTVLPLLVLFCVAGCGIDNSKAEKVVDDQFAAFETMIKALNSGDKAGAMAAATKVGQCEREIKSIKITKSKKTELEAKINQKSAALMPRFQAALTKAVSTGVLNPAEVNQLTSLMK